MTQLQRYDRIDVFQWGAQFWKKSRHDISDRKMRGVGTLAFVQRKLQMSTTVDGVALNEKKGRSRGGSEKSGEMVVVSNVQQPYAFRTLAVMHILVWDDVCDCNRRVFIPGILFVVVESCTERL